MNTPHSSAPILCFGESSWDIISGGQYPGGTAIAMAYHLQKLGLRAIPITRVGIDDTGKNLIRFAERHAIPPDYFQLDYELMTGKTFSTAFNGSVTQEISREAAWDRTIWDPAFTSIITENACLVFSSVAARDPISRNTLYQLMDAVDKKILQLKLRTSCYNRKTIEHCLTGLFLLQLTPEELELITGWFATYTSIDERIRVLQDRFRMPYVVVTNGHNGAVLNAVGHVYHHPGFSGAATEETGSSDAFLAGLLKGLLLHRDPGDTLEYGCAMGQLISGLPGACPDFQVEAVSRLITKNRLIS